MFVVTVEFVVKQFAEDDFRRAVLNQAQNTLLNEDDCLQFDVCFDEKDSSKCFLYEVYRSEKAFQFHLESTYLKDFNESTSSMLDSKTIQTWTRATLAESESQ